MENGESPSRQTWLDLAALFCLGLAFRIALLHFFPVPYGEDGFGRIYFKDRIFLGHWLPLAQGLVFATSRISSGIESIRLVFAVCGALAAGGFYLFLRRLGSRRTAWVGGLLFSFNRLFVILSLMPYQDVLFLGLYYAALAWLFRDKAGPENLRSKTGSLLFGLANLTRYEGWFALPVLGFWKLKRELEAHSQSKTVAALLRTGLFWGWAPLVWFAMSWLHWHGWNEFLFQPADRRFYGWHPHFDWIWVVRYGLRWGSWIFSFGSSITLLALWGGVRLAKSGKGLHPGLRLLLVNVALTTLFFFFVIGKEQETVFRFVMFAFSAVLVFTALGLDDLAGRWGRPRLTLAAATAILTGLIIHSTISVARLGELPEHRDPYQVARFLEANLETSETALVVAERVSNLQDDAPILYQRIVAQTRLDRGRVISAGNLAFGGRAQLLHFARTAMVRYLVVFPNFQPRLAADLFFSGLADAGPDWLEPVLGTATVRVYRVREWPEP